MSCKKELPVSASATVYTDIAYGTDAQQKADVYLPGGRTTGTTKTIVVIHGGAWTSGDKSDMTFAVDSLKNHLTNYAFFNLNYRLALNSTVNVFPTQENDVKAAIDFYLSKSAEYNVSGDLVLLGASAGAHLAMLQGYKNDSAKHIKAVVDFYGPTDLVAIWNQGSLQQLILFSAIGQTYTQDTAIYTQSSPINFITAASPPTIALQGGMDEIVIPDQTNLLISKLNSLGVTNQMILYPNEVHGFSAADNLDALNKIQAFISANVK